MKSILGLWGLAIFFTVATFGQQISPVLAILQTPLILLFAFWHGTERYGAASMFLFFLTVEVVSNGMENLSIATGFPFGHYHYAIFSGTPSLFHVPLLVGFVYFAYGYLAWVVANVLLKRIDEHLQIWPSALLLPLTASLLMTAWDCVMDPINSTVRHIWIWEDSGILNGVPITNFLGWFLTTYLFYQLFAIYVRMRTNTVQPQKNISYWLVPIFLYFIAGLSYMVLFFSADHKLITDITGNMWDVRTIYENAAVLGLCTTTFASFLALVRLRSSK